MTARVTVVRGDLTKQRVDAIVNAANEAVLGGGGVDGAIHRAAGPALLEACRRLPSVGGVRCATGDAVITAGFCLPARYVIHTVGPIAGRHPDPDAALVSAHRRSLGLAEAHGLRSIAFPAISCGVYGFPPERAAPITVDVAREAWDLDEIRFVLFSESLFTLWKEALAAG